MQKFKTDFIEFVLKHKVLSFGEFTLKSGRLSPYFFNTGKLNSGAQLAELGAAYANLIQELNLEVDCLFGPAYKGIPLVSSTAIALANNHDRDIPYCFNRKEEKDHGEGGIIVGAPCQNKVLIIDDVITAGTASRQSLALIKELGATPAGILIALDRQECGQGKDCSTITELEREFDIPVHAIITFNDLLNYLSTNSEFSEYYPAMQEYRAKYGQ